MTRAPGWALRGRQGWSFTGATRPAFAAVPGPGQESVWDYPRPPILDADDREVVVQRDGVPIARTTRAVRVLETASPPTFYLPPDDIDWDQLVPASGSSRCEWKGVARYFSVTAGGPPLERVAWSYPEPFDEFATIRDYVALYPAALDCRVDGERVRPQPGGFYGGWVTDELVGPFKGEPGSEGW